MFLSGPKLAAANFPYYNYFLSCHFRNNFHKHKTVSTEVLVFLYSENMKACINFSDWLSGCNASNPFRMHSVHHYFLISNHSP